VIAVLSVLALAFALLVALAGQFFSERGALIFATGLTILLVLPICALIILVKIWRRFISNMSSILGTYNVQIRCLGSFLGGVVYAFFITTFSYPMSILSVAVALEGLYLIALLKIVTGRTQKGRASGSGLDI